MIRQNKDGRPIYSDRTWAQIVEIGQRLIKLGYIESYKKPNLFYKPINAEIKDGNGKIVKVKGIIFADLRGTEIVPIWDEPAPLIYHKDLPFNIFLPEFIILKRSGCSPRVSFFEECEPDGWMFGLDDIPSGFCKRCGDDILTAVDWNILEKDFIELYEQGIDQNLEVNFCEICRKIEYDTRESAPAKLKENELIESSTPQEKEYVFSFEAKDTVQKPLEENEPIESTESSQVVEYVETKFDFIKNANYIENLIYESETSGAVRFGRKKDDRVLWIPRSIIKDGWDKDSPNEQTICLTFVPQKNFGWQERKKKNNFY